MADYGRNGVNSLGYLGVRATTPPQMLVKDRAPESTDVIGYALGTIWWHVHKDDPEASVSWILASSYDVVGGSNVPNTAVWVRVAHGGDIDLPIHSVALGTGVPGLTSTGPGTLGLPLVANGALIDPAFGIAGPNGGGTGLSDPLAHNILIGQGDFLPMTLAAPNATIGQPLVSTGAASDPEFGTASVSGGGTGLDQIDQYAVLCGGITDEGPLQTVSGTGTATQVLTSNGIGFLPTWQDSAGGTGVGGPIAVQVFTTPGAATYTPTVGMGSCIVEILGGGGGGGGTDTVTGQGNTGGSGGASGYSRRLFTSATIGASQGLVIGAGGAGGAIGNNPGVTGGNSTFGAFLTANGGVGGAAGSVGNSPRTGGAGGTATGGDINIDGQYGYYGGANTGGSPEFYASNAGGSAMYGAGGFGTDGGQVTGANATGYGSGGAGGINYTSGGPIGGAAGGDGSDGIVIITEYGPYGVLPPINPISISVTVYDTPGAGTFTPNPSMFQCQVEVLGGGGAGGGTTGTSACAGGGGGASGYSKKLFDSATIGAGQDFFVGSGGTGIAASTGNPGTSSTFGTVPIITCTGGSGGQVGSNNGANGNGGAGGTATGGDLNLPGQRGTSGVATIAALGGQGGSTIYGGGGNGASGSALSSPSAGVGYGSGGGAIAGASGSIAAAANGASGVIIITEYIQ